MFEWLTESVLTIWIGFQEWLRDAYANLTTGVQTALSKITTLEPCRAQELDLGHHHVAS
jgi:hypothetical protein